MGNEVEEKVQSSPAGDTQKPSPKLPYSPPRITWLGKDLSDVGGLVGPFDDGFGAEDQQRRFS